MLPEWLIAGFWWVAHFIAWSVAVFVTVVGSWTFWRRRFDVDYALREGFRGELMPWPARWSLLPERPMLMIVGRRGRGKTAIATKQAVERMRMGERVYANYEIFDQEYGLRAGRVHALWQCMDLSDCTVIVDEASSWINSREWAKMPTEIINRWQHSRKTSVAWVFTTQHENRTDLVVRELVDLLWIMSRPWWCPTWIPLFRVDETELEDVSRVRRGERGEVSRLVWVGDDVMRAYDTKEEVSADALVGLREYQAALATGDIEVEMPVEQRREPSILFEDGSWGEWPELRG